MIMKPEVLAPSFAPECLTEIAPTDILQHGPTKMYVDHFLWFSPEIGAAAAYRPTEGDVKDHFDVFRGVDQVESFAQGTAVAACTFLESQKRGLSLPEFQDNWNIAFLGVEQVKLHKFLRKGEVFVSLAQIDFYRFRQMTVSGKTYRVPGDLDLRTYFESYTETAFKTYQLPADFELIGEIEGLKVSVLPKTKF